ncbi:hypothetical protein M3194_25165 [Paenibacillus glycanilyticus]|uniref:hypothetical protein n=1 Tax=Paenibacillus glycanilyticus TaxID=126569 RepID=UPI00203BC97D|nr:hypothetical protein [Paenibacillus glycanilyticus]MCM3630626.1 hypothetical protein [Paenibacillus glycanilyticus]
MVNVGVVYEPGHEELLREGLRKGKLTFTTSTQQGIQTSDVLFNGVGARNAGRKNGEEQGHSLREAQ